MRSAILIAVTLLAAIACAADPTPLPLPPAGVVSVWRKELTLGDPLRDWTLTWRVEGKLLALPAPFTEIGYSVPIGSENGYVRAFRLPAGSTPPDGFTLYTPPAVPTTQIGPNNLSDADNLQRNLDVGNVTLLPGIYYISHTIRPPPNRIILGRGATLVRTNLTGEYHHDKMFEAAPRCSYIGITFDTPNLVCHGDNPSPNMVFHQCVIRGGTLGFWSSPDGLLVDSCLFDRAGAGQPNGGLYLRCRFKGMCLNGYHAFCTQSCDNIAMVDCEFDGTDRGPVLRGAINSPLLRGISIRGVGHVEGGNELFGGEGGQGSFVDRGLFIHWRFGDGNEGDVTWWDIKVTRSLFWDFAGRDWGFWIGLQPFEDNWLLGFEQRGGGGVSLGSQARRNKLERIAVTGWMPRRTNDFLSMPSRYVTAGRAVIEAGGLDAASNYTVGCSVVGSPPEVVPYRGITQQR